MADMIAISPAHEMSLFTKMFQSSASAIILAACGGEVSTPPQSTTLEEECALGGGVVSKWSCEARSPTCSQELTCDPGEKTREICQCPDSWECWHVDEQRCVSHSELCTRSGGTWEDLTCGGHADACRLAVCEYGIHLGCDCPTGSCWSRTELACVGRRSIED